MIVEHKATEAQGRLQKLSFALTDAQVGPFPVSSEALWCSEEQGNYRVKNIPFFIEGVSFDDLLVVARDGAGDRWRIQNVIEPSGNSTIWVYANDSAKGAKVVDRLIAMGCGAESGVIPDLYAVNVPADQCIGNVYEILDAAIEEGLVVVDYPSIRHADEGMADNSQR